MITALRRETFENLQLNAGLFAVNFDYSKYTDAAGLIAALKQLVANNTVVGGSAIPEGGALLGATIGGGTFTATPTIRHIDADGKRYEFKGSTINDGWTIQMTGTLKEVTAGTLKTTLVMADVKTEGNVQTITLHTDIRDADYIGSLIWVGDTSRGAALIDLKNALNTAGASMTFSDKGEATIPFTFVAHQDDVEDYDEAPVKILFFTTPEAAAASAEPGGEQGEPAAYDPEAASAEA